MKGNYRELSIREEKIPDGRGGEQDGVTIRLFVDDEDSDPDDVLAVELHYAQAAHVPDVHEFIASVLRIWEIEP